MAYSFSSGLLALFLLLVASVTDAQAKPLITHSEQTLESVCLDYDDTPERLIEICMGALATQTPTESERLDMMDALAWAYNQLDDETAAQQVFEDMLAIQSTDPDALMGLGWLAHNQDDYDGAAIWFERAMEARPDEEALAGLASSLNRSGQATLEEVLPLIDAALAIDTDYAWAVREKGWLLFNAARYEAAQQSFEAALALDPDDGYAHYAMAYVLSEQDQWVAALLNVNRALDSLPDFGAAVSRRSLILLHLDRPAQALRDAERLIEMWPDDSDGYVRAARAQADLGSLRAALDTLDRAQAAVGYEGYLYYWRATILDYDDRPREALAVLSEVFARGDEDLFDHALRIGLLIDLREFEQARAAVDKALKTNSEAPWLVFYDAVVLVHEAAYETAEARFDAAIAAGLPHERLAYFLKQLTGAARYVQAVQMRVRYADLAAQDIAHDG